ncbi:PREDICTED: UDP-glycosyltransferase 76E2-like [Fragaria vesca subsp. vesca]|uniref:UDP-glycosyltransferase 76E2-like n=1 Tax=Fragaria vesca subsp. vesca TaxID=101020 RepID=UPI0002C2EADC|nr:PREDICTED: UDP-glycosyltransferase 76E2-like [Fragaria vesca subsp. vesca]
MEMQGQRLVLVPCPYQGHINPMLQLGTFLHSKGFSITIVHTQFNSPSPSNHPEFTFIPIPDGLTVPLVSSGNIVAILLAINANCKSSFEQCLTTQVMEQEPEKKITCIIYDEFMYFSAAAANHLNIPSIILRTTSAANFLARSTVIELHSKGHIPFPESVSLDPVPQLHLLRFKDLPISTFDTLENFLRVVVNSHDVRRSSAIVCNTTVCLDQSSLAQIQEHCQVPIFCVGPLHKLNTAAPISSLLEEDTSCIEWLDKQSHKSVIYVSLGSVASIGEKELAEMTWGLANSKQPFLWVIRPGSINGSDWIELLPQEFREAIGERGFIVKWAPQREVLAHGAVGAFWTHCGWNSTLERISEGVPMICKPCFGDQKVHARHVSEVWRLGIELGDVFERGEIERAVRKVLVDNDGEEIRVRAKDMKEKIQVSMSSGGSTYNFLNKLVELIIRF